MAAFPDMRVTFDTLSTEGERTLFHWTLIGTNTGPDGAGDAVKISGEESWLFGPDGLVAESRGGFDAEDYLVSWAVNRTFATRTLKYLILLVDGD